MDYFYDLEFPPLRHSIYNGNAANPLDIYVHWRRPKDFIETPELFADFLEPTDI